MAAKLCLSYIYKCLKNKLSVLPGFTITEKNIYIEKCMIVYKYATRQENKMYS